MLKISNLGKTFADGTRVLNDISFEIQPREFVVVLGPSGAGKTSLLRMINGLFTITHGKILVNDIEVTPDSLREVSKKVGMVFQHFNLVGNLSAINNVLTGILDEASTVPSLFYLFSKKHKLQALECLDQVGLLSKAYTRVDNLSGGQQQRVGIARAIIKKPALLLADEPIASLDPIVAFNILSLLKEINNNHGITVVCNLHQVDFALHFADRILGLANGQMVLDKPIEEINKHYIQSIYEKHNHGMFFGLSMDRTEPNAESQRNHHVASVDTL